MRLLNIFSTLKNNYENIILYENDYKKVYIYNMYSSEAFSISKEDLINKMKKYIILDYNQNINNLSAQEKNTIISELISVKIKEKENCNLSACKLSINLNAFFSKLPYNRIFLKIFNAIVLYFPLPVFLLGLIICFANKYNYLGTNINFKFIFIFIIILFFSIIFHEISHAFMAIYYGAFVPEIGFKIRKVTKNMAFPVFYTTVIGKSSINKKHTIKILLSGPLANLLLTGISLNFYNYNNTFFFVAAILNILMLVTNLTTLLYTDGYFILEQILNNKNLFNETFRKLFIFKNENKILNKANKIYLWSCLFSIIIYIIIIIYIGIKIF